MKRRTSITIETVERTVIHQVPLLANQTGCRFCDIETKATGTAPETFASKHAAAARREIVKIMRKMIFTAILVNILAAFGLAQATGFIYQGKLMDNATFPTGDYDLEVTLWDSLANGSQVGATQTFASVPVRSGIFSVDLDFGLQFDGNPRFLQIAVRPAGGGTYTTLAPRQTITPTPYSIRSLNSASAGSSDSLSSACVSCVTAGQVGAVNGSVVTGEIPVASVPAGSDKYIQNQTSQTQTPSSFKISGNGTAAVFDAGTQYNIGGNRVLTTVGIQNLFVGLGAGGSNSSGMTNTFVGNFAGNANGAGAENTFVGADAGRKNLSNGNAFFGARSGENTLNGDSNAFFGAHSGQSNVSGAFNAYFGHNAGFSTNSSSNSFFGFYSGFSNTAGGNSFFGYFSGRNNTTGSGNAFFGLQAGAQNVTGNRNSFFGSASGGQSTGSDNSFFGSLSGFGNTAGTGNAFFGSGTGQANTSGNNNTFFGGSSGTSNTTGNNNTTLGSNANVGSGNLSFATAIGSGSTVTTSNSVTIGRAADTVIVPGTLVANLPLNDANYIQNGPVSPQTASINVTGAANLGGNLSAGGFVNASEYRINASRVLGVTGTQNLFVGPSSGAANTTGSSNAFAGSSAGSANTTGNNNAYFGSQSGMSGTTGGGNSYFGSEAGKNSGGTDSSFFGYQSGQNNTGLSNTFIGAHAGMDTTDSFNSFVGESAGRFNTTGFFNSFVGWQAGYLNTTGFSNSYFGVDAGGPNNVNSPGTGTDNSFFGYRAGKGIADGIQNTYLGAHAGGSGFGDNNTAVGAYASVEPTIGNPHLNNSTAIGFQAAVTQNDSLVLGRINGVNGSTGDTNVGIGTTAPNARLQVQNGNIYVGSPGQGMILRSPDGATCRLLSIDNAGAMVLSAIVCP